MSEYDEDFTRLSELRMLAGLREYRGGDASLPFAGDPVKCGMEEALDLRNYALHALQRDDLTAYEAGEVIDHARQAFRILWLSNRHRNRVQIEEQSAVRVHDHRDEWERGPHVGVEIGERVYSGKINRQGANDAN